ncbi:hypothetical protein [Brevibacillus reuszeri]|uniref:hypothetical protein n=1 Tax=Brevibacillus reuszeri TaxID=54915 RepID=UPI003D198D27
MMIGQNCLVVFNSALVLAKVEAIYQHNVVVQLLRNRITEPQVIDRDKVIGSVSEEAFEAIEKHMDVLVKSNFQ